MEWWLAGENKGTWRKIYLTVTLSTINLTFTALEFNLGFHSKPVTAWAMAQADCIIKNTDIYMFVSLSFLSLSLYNKPDSEPTLKQCGQSWCL
jgi:hypothetical protein